METILIIEDDDDIRELLAHNVGKNGFRPLTAEDGIAGRAMALKHSPDLILLDLMLPGINGLDLCRLFRKEPATADTPIIMLTAKEDEESKVRGFDLGADDYVTKPFSIKEVFARINARLKNSKKNPVRDNIFSLGTLTINFDSHIVSVAGKNIKLSRTEFDLLKFFVTKKRKVYSREELLDHVWGESHFVEQRTVDVHIRRLREKIHPEGEKNIKTVRGVGYIFSDENDTC